MIPKTFKPFQNAAYPCFFLDNDGVLYQNEAVGQAGPPLSNQAEILSLLRVAAQQMKNSGETVTHHPLLTDALRMRTFTLMVTDEGLLAVGSAAVESPVTIFSSQMREQLGNILATIPMVNNQLEDSQLHLTSDIQYNCYQLLRLSADLEDAGFVESKKYRLVPTDLADLVDKLCYNVASVTNVRQVPLEWQVPETPVMVEANVRLMMAALLNVIRNSLAYSRDGNKINVRLTQAGKNALITVEDKGLGIRPENMTGIFKPYFSVDPYGDSNVRPGVGLGLSVTQQALAAFGGSVKAESRFGEGTSIFLSLPLYTGSTAALESEPVEYMLGKYSPIFIQLCGYCLMPQL